MLTSVTRAVVVIGALAFVTAAVAQTPVQPGKVGKVGKTAKGQTLVNQKDMTLYVFDKDAGGKSACDGECAQKWLPLTADASAQPEGRWTVVTRDDGTKQWAFAGKPLYTWGQDKTPGDMTGDGVANAWHAATACRITTCEDGL